jgi:hypothetical protein
LYTATDSGRYDQDLEKLDEAFAKEDPLLSSLGSTRSSGVTVILYCQKKL